MREMYGDLQITYAVLNSGVEIVSTLSKNTPSSTGPAGSWSVSNCCTPGRTSGVTSTQCPMNRPALRTMVLYAFLTSSG